MMKKQNITLITLLTLFIFTGISTAQENKSASEIIQKTSEEIEKTENLLDMDFEALMDIAITSVSKKAENIQHVPSSVYVITKEDIRRSSAQNLMQLLRDHVPGLFGVANDYRNSDVFIRNTYEGSVLFLLDGAPLMDINSVNLDFESFSIPWQQIDRIEIIKGSGGTIYGANAASGVVSIFTKHPEDQPAFYANADYALPGKAEVSISTTPVKKDNFSTTIYGTYSTFSGFEQISETENKTSVVDATYTDEQTTITNRFTGDDKTFNFFNGGYKLSYHPSAKIELSSGFNLVTTQNDVYFQELNRENAYFINDNGSPAPRLDDQVALISNNKTRMTGHVRGDYNINDNHSVFLRYAINNDNRAYSMGYTGNNTVHDFEIQDNLTLGSNNLSFGANFRLLQYNLDARRYSPVAFINPKANESLKGFFVQNKTELFEGKLNLYYGVKAETFSLINDDFYWSPMAKFTILPTEDLTIWGGYTKSYTTPGYNQTNIELDVFRANTSALYPFYYPQVEQAVYTNAYQEAIAGGADQA
ncbi:TonB-dependent receptor plug domain-containing protein, partial [Marinilabilia sp.]